MRGWKRETLESGFKRTDNVGTELYHPHRMRVEDGDAKNTPRIARKEMTPHQDFSEE